MHAPHRVPRRRGRRDGRQWPPAFVVNEFRKFLRGGVLSHGFARVRRGDYAFERRDDFYSTTIYPTEVRVRGRWVRVVRQRMDGMLVVDTAGDETRVPCRLLRDLRVGDLVVCGIDGVRTHPTVGGRSAEGFGFMSAEVSSERRVELSDRPDRVGDPPYPRARRQARGGHEPGRDPTPAARRHLARLIRGGYAQALLAGNGFAAHDIEQSLFGLSLRVEVKRGINVQGGHQYHLVRSCASNYAPLRVPPGRYRPESATGRYASQDRFEEVRHETIFHFHLWRLDGGLVPPRHGGTRRGRAGRGLGGADT